MQLCMRAFQTPSAPSQQSRHIVCVPVQGSNILPASTTLAKPSSGAVVPLPSIKQAKRQDAGLATVVARARNRCVRVRMCMHVCV